MEPPLGAGATRYDNADLLDCFGILLPEGTKPDAYALACLALGDPPGWFRALMALRDGIMLLFGVETSAGLRARQKDIPHIDFFPVLGISESEIELGADDRHLDFRAWFSVEETREGLLFRATTVVRVRNLLGRLYLAAVRPFHVIIVRASLNRAARRLRSPAI